MTSANENSCCSTKDQTSSDAQKPAACCASQTDAVKTDSAIVPLSEQPAAVAASAEASNLISIDQFMATELRVAQIEAAEAVPKSKKLLKLQVTLGEVLGKRQILAGIAQFYTPEELLGQRVVVVANLQPAKLMGLESQGMLLAASNDDNTSLTVVQPAKEIPLGARVR